MAADAWLSVVPESSLFRVRGNGDERFWVDRVIAVDCDLTDGDQHGAQLVRTGLRVDLHRRRYRTIPRVTESPARTRS